MIKFKDRIKRLRRGADYENYYTALDIGTEYIKALVVKREGRNGMVLGASRQRQEYADMQAGGPIGYPGDNRHLRPGEVAGRGHVRHHPRAGRDRHRGRAGQRFSTVL